MRRTVSFYRGTGLLDIRVPTVYEYRRYLMATTRISRSERKARTREELLVAARRVFLRRGFHGATLEEIADEAGYTKGAVYSNFAGKDDLYLALLDAHYDRRVEAYAEMMLDETTFEDAVSAVGRFMAQSDARDPDWLPTLAEFVAHAARDESLRRAYVRTRERFLVAIADVIRALCDRHDLSLLVPPLEAARASSMLARGYSAERRLDPDAVSSEIFVELHAAFMRGLTVPGERSHT
jgi:AcrR family transcriptional regulator